MGYYDCSKKVAAEQEALEANNKAYAKYVDSLNTYNEAVRIQTKN